MKEFIIIEPMCHLCTRTEGFSNRGCLAFPQGIPQDILEGKFNHRKPWPKSKKYPEGDRGYQFKKRNY